ncbi:hypothetical protein ZIOFF_039057 [Zingiber officinale]|uniref:Uncharacterized protein n=1 Tax=Zingiber officinale TaxID=94328 RepID=A0A8J5L3I1_ZINOF|nr:hypothetical protein ZIOFF_039057 [Zingiber officinale]
MMRRPRSKGRSPTARRVVNVWLTSVTPLPGRAEYSRDSTIFVFFSSSISCLPRLSKHSILSSPRSHSSSTSVHIYGGRQRRGALLSNSQLHNAIA